VSRPPPEEVYLATHETTGATALVRKHTAEERQSPGKDWRVFVSSWASRGYSVMEVVHRWSGLIAAMVCALLFALVRPASVSPPMSAPPAPVRHEVPMAAGTADFNAWLADTTPSGQTVLARPLPKEPFKGQKRPPLHPLRRS
jgi:hypothetical protein